jgi:hypothetical protein
MSQASTDLVAYAPPRNRDPIFEAIAAHRAAVAAYYKIDIRTPEAEAKAIFDAMYLAQYAMDGTKPTTLGGLVAYLDHVADESYVHTLFGNDDETNKPIREFIRDVRDALTGIAQ